MNSLQHLVSVRLTFYIKPSSKWVRVFNRGYVIIYMIILQRSLNGKKWWKSNNKLSYPPNVKHPTQFQFPVT